MKKTILIFTLCLTAIAGIFAWYKVNPEPITVFDVLQFGIILTLIVFAIILAIKRISSHREGLPPEDELSKKILKIAAARSYYLSLYLWLILMYFSGEGKYEIESLFGAGILGMAVLLLINWVIIKYTGLKNE